MEAHDLDGVARVVSPEMESTMDNEKARGLPASCCRPLAPVETASAVRRDVSHLSVMVAAPGRQERNVSFSGE